MNFKEEIKKEIISKTLKDKCCKKSFLIGLIRGGGTLFSSEEGLGLDFTVKSEELASICTNYLRTLFDYEVRTMSVIEDKLTGLEKFKISICGQDSEEVLVKLGVLIREGEELSVNMDFFGDFAKKECCLKSFFRGLFITTGVVTTPSNDSSTGYHLELSFSHSKTASLVNLKLLDNGVHTKIMRRKGKFVVYIKSVEEIKNFLAFLSLPLSVLKLTELIIEREITNASNRATNCDLANVEKQVEASAKQISAINKIKKYNQSLLSDTLKEVAEARLTYKDETLVELSSRLNISKSCLNHRLRRIIAIADGIKEE